MANKLWISQLFDGVYAAGQDDNVNHLELDNNHIVRVNLIGSITYVKLNEGYASAILDDGSAAIRIKAWQQDTSMISKINLGDFALVIGRIREFNNERYVLPDFIKKLDDPNWLLVRRLELLRLYKNAFKQKEDTPPEEKIEIQAASINLRSKILSTIESIDQADGVSIDDVASSSSLPRMQVDNIISSLVKEGEVYEHKPGRYKLLQ